MTSPNLTNDPYLKFTIVTANAQPVKPSFSLQNLLDPEKSKSFCSMTKSNINILLKYTGGNNGFTLREFEVRVPEGKGSPLKNGLLFVSDSYIDVDSTCKFNNFTKEKFDALRDPPSASLPVLYFEIPQGQVSSHIVLPHYVEGKYILVKFISTWCGSVFNAEFIGFKGTNGTIPKPAGPIALSPLDIMSTIFHLLDLNTFLVCALVSKTWNTWANSDAVWSRLFDKYQWPLENSEIPTGNLKRIYVSRALPHVDDWILKGPGKDYQKQQNYRALRDIYVCMLGSSKSGKSALAQRWSGSKYSYEEKVRHTVIQYKRRRLNIFDLSGADEDHHLWPDYYRGVDVVTWVVDGSNRENLNDVKSLMKSTLQPILDPLPLAVFVGKKDMVDSLDTRDVIQKLELGKLKQELKLPSVYVQSGSAVDDNDEGVWNLLDWLVFNCHRKQKKKKKEQQYYL